MNVNFDASFQSPSSHSYSWIIIQNEEGLGDSLAMVKKANSLHDDRLEIAVLIKEGTYKLRNCFTDTIVQHCFQQVNRVTHHLTAMGVVKALISCGWRTYHYQWRLIS
ncbi:hypothetical protein Goklo_007267 [Gossypium klotzschianum]|uniref:Uncharacterized protein n=1 Tax=Gossypium klotzschianum TaxID=34286 RepID=A0A7J8WCI1_9ROSI|nr:hypothetical protein [Gossypium klotzschianum]